VVGRHALAVVLIASFGALLVASMLEESPVTDEPVHLTRGLAYWWAPDARLSYAHPPLGNAFAALPIARTEPPVDMGRLTGFERGEVEAVGQSMIEPHYEERRAWFFEARIGVAILALALAIYLYGFCFVTWGPRVALASLFFFATFPTIIAHGRLVTTDMPVTLAMFVALGELTSFLRGRGRVHFVICAVMTGVALATKYSAIALLPIATVLLFGAALFKQGRFRFTHVSIALASALGMVVLLVLSAWLTINLAYRFEDTCLTVGEMLKRPEPINAITAGYQGNLLEKTAVGRLPRDLVVPIPYSYVLGFSSVAVHADHGHSTTFFGVKTTGGDWRYFPVLLAIKTPALMLLALAAGLVVWVRRRFRARGSTLAMIWFVGAIVFLATRSSLNIGVRHVLPAMPVMAVLAGIVSVAAFDRMRARALRHAVFGGLAIAHAAGLAWCFPDYVSDFNLLVGGRERGERVSIVGEEWGQDMVRLGRLLKENQITSVLYTPDGYTAKNELELFDVEMSQLDCGMRQPRGRWVAINMRSLARNRDACFPWTEGRTPDLRVGGHIYVYAPEPPRPR
jgi:4-amino-4-deoxy-L-arabinose transferase-like glycosyltransferase